MKIRRIIREILEASLSEAMMTIDKMDPNIGLFIQKTHGSIHLNLFDPIKDKVYATISIHGLDSGNYAVSGVAAEYGYGSLMYELAMTYIYPRALMPTRDGDVRTNAINIWNRFLSRGDVRKDHIVQDDNDFPWEYYEDMGDDLNDSGSRFMFTRFYYDGAKKTLDELSSRGDRYLRDGVVDLSDVDYKSSEFFSDMYG